MSKIFENMREIKKLYEEIWDEDILSLNIEQHSGNQLIVQIYGIDKFIEIAKSNGKKYAVDLFDKDDEVYKYRIKTELKGNDIGFFTLVSKKEKDRILDELF